MAPSLRDRLLGRTGELTPATDAPDAKDAPGQSAPAAPTPPSHNGSRQRPTPSGVHAPEPVPQAVRKHDPGGVSAVEKLKLELHRKLNDRLALAAREATTGEPR